MALFFSPMNLIFAKEGIVLSALKSGLEESKIILP